MDSLRARSAPNPRQWIADGVSRAVAVPQIDGASKTGTFQVGVLPALLTQAKNYPFRIADEGADLAIIGRLKARLLMHC